MALVKCPDCGKMVSERVESCPFCGCPASYFESNGKSEGKVTEAIDKRTENKEKKKYDKSENIKEDRYENAREALIEFSFLGKTLCYPLNAEAYITAIKLHNNAAAKGERELKKCYKDVEEMDKVWDEVVPLAEAMIDKIVKENVGLLYSANIYISEKDFKKKYNINFRAYIKDVMDAYDTLIHSANNLRQTRQSERAGRSHWQGGGFGLKGAIKGAVTAGALNAVTGAGRAIGDSVVDSSDNANLQKAKQSIYNDEKYQFRFLYGLRRCISEADIGLAEELVHKGVTKSIPIDFDKASKIFSAAYEYEKNEKNLALKAIDAITLYPIFATFYKPLISEMIVSDEEDKDEILRFMKFWNMEEDYPSVFEDAKKRTLINEYFKIHTDAMNVDFTDYRPSTYVKLRNVRKDLIQIIGSSELPTLVPFCMRLNKYYKECLDKEFCLDSIDVLDGVDEESSIDDFVYRIHDEKLALSGLLKDIWVKGDKNNIPDAKIKNKWEIPNEDTIYMYQNKAIFGTAFGGKGFVLTNSTLCDLNSKRIIRLKDIINTKYDTDLHNIIISDGNSEIVIDLIAEKPASRRFLYICLETFVMRYAGLTDEEKHMLVVKATANKINEIIAKYAEHNGVDDLNGLLEEFLIKQGLLKAKSDIIFCPYCGEKIMRVAKFCNFCGMKNNYEH